MNFSRNPFPATSSFPTVPPSLSADGHGMREDYAAQGAQDGVPRAAMHSLEDVKPYLGLRSRLSQVWINRWTVLILLVLARVLIAIGSLRNDIDSAQTQALAACTTVESLGSNMASLPHYLSTGVNALAADGVTRAVNGLHTGLFDVVTAAEEIFVFWVNMLYGVYECLITFAVAGSLHTVIGATEDIVKFVNSTVQDVGNDINTALGDFNTALKGFESSINDVSSVLSGGKSAPATLDLSSEMGKLSNMQFPTTINDELTKLNNSIPNFDQVKNFTDNVLRMPFEEVKTLMNKSLGVFQFDQSVFPVPERQQLTFCSDDDGISDFFNTLYDLADTARKVFIVTLLLAALIACIPMGYIEIRRWRSMNTYAQRMQMHAVDPVDGVYIASRPWTALGGIKLSQYFRSPKAQTLARWFIAYITSVPALVLLSVALAGLLSCLCQYILLKAVSKEVPALAQDIGAFADKVIDALNNASAQWANGTNTVINNTNNEINKNVFGWVNTSTHAVNDTLNAFVNETTNVLNATFGGTVLYDPIMEVYQCLVGMKVAAIENGLTWVSDHAYIEFPLFPNDTFSAGAQAALTTNKTTANGQNNSFLADPGDSATDKVTQAVADLASKIANGIRTEALLSTALLALYLLVVIMGLVRCLYIMCRSSKGRAEGAPSYAGDVAPGAVVDNTNIAASVFGTAAPRPAPPDAYQIRNSLPVEIRRVEIPNPAPPMYEPPKEGSRFRMFREPMPGGEVRQSKVMTAFDDEAQGEEGETTYQNEKMGFTNSGNGLPVRPNRHVRKSSHAEVINEKRGVF